MTKQISCSARNDSTAASKGKPRTRMKSPNDAAFGQQIERFANGRIAAAQSDDAERGAGAAMDDGGRDELRGGFVLFQQAIHHFLVFVGNFGVAAELVVAGAAGEVGRLWDARRASVRGATWFSSSPV